MIQCSCKIHFIFIILSSKIFIPSNMWAVKTRLVLVDLGLFIRLALRNLYFSHIGC